VHGEKVGTEGDEETLRESDGENKNEEGRVKEKRWIGCVGVTLL